MKKLKEKKGIIYFDTVVYMIAILACIIAVGIFLKSRYIQVDFKTPREVEAFVNSNKDKKGAHLLQTKEYTYVLVTAGKTVDEKPLNVLVNSPVYNGDKTTATITYQLIPFKTNDYQKRDEPDSTLLKLQKVDSVTTTETNENVVEKTKNN